VVTGVYAALTYGILAATRRSVDTMRQQTEALSRPYITVSPFVLREQPYLVPPHLEHGNTAAKRGAAGAGPPLSVRAHQLQPSERDISKPS